MLSEIPISDSSIGAPLNKSLLFHPRVGEEAKNLLYMKDDALARQLIQALEQTNSDHMLVKIHINIFDGIIFHNQIIFFQ